MRERHVCAFCGRDQSEAGRLFSGPLLYICDVCVDRMSAVLDGRKAELETRTREEVERAVQESFKSIVASLDLGPLNEKYQRLIKVKFKEEEPDGPGFEEVFDEFKRGVEEVIPADDYQSRYDLGIAYHEMALEQDAFRELSSSLRYALQKHDYEKAKEIMSALLYLVTSPERVMEAIRNTFQQLG
jgi:thioredoxin-like negative regulator of GroEL